jgi:hypothetical protein
MKIVLIAFLIDAALGSLEKRALNAFGYNRFSFSSLQADGGIYDRVPVQRF